MELSKNDMITLYLYEMGSFDIDDQPEISPTLTKEAICIRCGVSREDLSQILETKPNNFIVKKKRVINRRMLGECIFLKPKGVQVARSIMMNVKNLRVEYLDEDSVRRNITIGEMIEELKGFNISMTYFDIFLVARRDGKVNLLEFIEPRDWKKNLISDHAFPELVVLSNTSCNPFGGIFTTFGEPGMILPVNKKVEVGVHPYGKGNVIRWMKRRDGKITDAFHIEGKKGFESLVSGHSPMLDRFGLFRDMGVFESEEEYRQYFEVLSNYDYSIIFSGGTGHGISMAGHAGTILASIAMYLKDGIAFPFNGLENEEPKNPKLRSEGKLPVWDFPEPTEPMTIEDMVNQRHPDPKVNLSTMGLMKKFLVLSQIFEGHWNSYFSKEEMDRIQDFRRSFDLKGFSSGGAAVCSIFGVPVLLKLAEDGQMDLSSRLYPDMARNQNIGLLIDRKGGIDNPRSEFLRTFKRFVPLIEMQNRITSDYFKSLKRTSGILANLAANVLLESQKFADPSSMTERKAVSNLIMMQRGIYGSLGIRNGLFEAIQSEIVDREIDMNLGPIGVGNSGTYFFCVPDTESMHSMKNMVAKLNKDRAEEESLEIAMHGSSHSYIFNIDPLTVVKK